MTRDRVIISLGGLYSVAALVAAYEGHGVLALCAMLVMLTAINLWLTPRSRASRSDDPTA